MDLKLRTEGAGPAGAKLGEAFRLYQGWREAVCELWSHSAGWELRVRIDGEVVRTAVCRSRNHMHRLVEFWSQGARAGGLEVRPRLWNARSVPGAAHSYADRRT